MSMVIDDAVAKIDGIDYKTKFEEHKVFLGSREKFTYVCEFVLKYDFKMFEGIKTAEIFGKSFDVYCGGEKTVIEAGNHSISFLKGGDV